MCRGSRLAFQMVALVGLVGLAVAQPADPKGRAPRQPRRYTIEQFAATTALSEASFSSDERSLLFTSNRTGIPNAYTVPVGGGEAAAVTRSTADSTYAVSFFPADGRILYRR